MNEIELKSQLEKLRAEYKSKYDAYPDKVVDGVSHKDIPASDVEGLRKLMADINDAGAKHDEAVRARTLREGIDADEKADKTPVGRTGVPEVKAKSLVDALIESDEYKSQNKANGHFQDFSADVDMKQFFDLEQKTTMTTTAGFAPFVLRDGKVIPAISRPPQFIDYLRIEPTTSNAVKFMKQSTRTNNAAAKAEGAALAEAAIAYTEATVDIRKVGVYLPVTEEQLEDETEIRNIVEQDLRLMVRQELDRLCTVGDGVSPNILGVANVSGILTQARGADPHFDALMKAMTAVRTSGRANPNLVLLHSTDYQTVALTRTADGVYILGNPADAPLQRVWGIGIGISEALTAGTGLVMDTDYLRLKLRKDVTIAASDSHDTNFIKNITTLRAHVRAGLQVMRDEAICEVTGL